MRREIGRRGAGGARMSFATDRDLLALEPALFREVVWSSQKLAEAAGVTVAGSTLTAPGADFVGAGVGEGHVALVNGVAHEVVARQSATALTVSRLREEPSGPPVPPAPASGATLVVATFAPQIRIVHEQVMRALGIEPAGTPGAPAQPAPWALTEQSIVNPRALARAEAAGALHLILSGAAALVGDDSPLWAKAAAYRERFAAERRRACALVDLDGDGVADAVRRVSVSRLERA